MQCADLNLYGLNGFAGLFSSLRRKGFQYVQNVACWYACSSPAKRVLIQCEHLNSSLLGCKSLRTPHLLEVDNGFCERPVHICYHKIYLLLESPTSTSVPARGERTAHGSKVSGEDGPKMTPRTIFRSIPVVKGRWSACAAASHRTAEAGMEACPWFTQAGTAGVSHHTCRDRDPAGLCRGTRGERRRRCAVSEEREGGGAEGQGRPGQCVASPPSAGGRSSASDAPRGRHTCFQ